MKKCNRVLDEFQSEFTTKERLENTEEMIVIYLGTMMDMMDKVLDFFEIRKNLTDQLKSENPEL